MPRLRGGQLAANCRDELRGRRRSPVLSWFDNDAGRYLVKHCAGTDGRRWLTIAPADAATLETHLGEMVAQLTADRR